MLLEKDAFALWSPKAHMVTFGLEKGEIYSSLSFRDIFRSCSFEEEIPNLIRGCCGCDAVVPVSQMSGAERSTVVSHTPLVCGSLAHPVTPSRHSSAPPELPQESHDDFRVES